MPTPRSPHRRPPAPRRRAALLGVLLLATWAGAAFARDPRALARGVGRWRVYRAGGRMLASSDVVWQVGPSDCGPAALANALRLAGHPAPTLATLTRLAGTAPSGTSLGQLTRAAERLGVAVRQLAGRDARLAGPNADIPWPLPIVAWVDSAHFVVVERVTGGDVHIVDPEVGRYVLPRAAAWRWWSGAILIVPTQRRPPMNSG